MINNFKDNLIYNLLRLGIFLFSLLYLYFTSPKLTHKTAVLLINNNFKLLLIISGVYLVSMLLLAFLLKNSEKKNLINSGLDVIFYTVLIIFSGYSYDVDKKNNVSANFLLSSASLFVLYYFPLLSVTFTHGLKKGLFFALVPALIYILLNFLAKEQLRLPFKDLIVKDLSFFLVVLVAGALAKPPSEEDSENITRKLQTTKHVPAIEITKDSKDKKYDPMLIVENNRKISSSLKLDEILPLSLESVCSHLNAEIAALFLKDKATGDFVLSDETSIGLSIASIQKLRFKPEDGLLGEAAEKGVSIMVDEQNEDPRIEIFATCTENIRTLLFVPVKSADDVIGVLMAANKQGESRFTAGDERIAKALAAQTAVSMVNAELYRKLENNYLNTIHALAEAIDAKDTYTKGHSTRVAIYSILIAQEMSLPKEEIKTIQRAALLHDIGKIRVPDNILLKPGTLNNEEFEIIKNHPVVGGQILEKLGFLEGEVAIIYHHHERFEGKGYPQGLAGQDIPRGACIVAVADTFDAMTSDRPFRKSFTFEETIRKMRALDGTQFEPNSLKAFLQVCEKRSERIKEVMQKYK